MTENFAGSFELLPSAAQDALRVFGLVRVPSLSVAEVSLLVEEPKGSTRAALIALRRAGLVERVARDRYRVHDRVHEHALRHSVNAWTEDSRRRRFERYLDYIVTRSYVAERAIYPQRDDMPDDLRDDLGLAWAAGGVDEAYQWFEDERESLLAAIQQASDQGRFESVWRLAWTVTTFLDRRGYWADYERTQRLGLSAAEALGRISARSLSHRLLATALSRLGRQPEARSHLEQSLRFARELGDANGEARTWLAIAFSHHADNRLRDALASAQRAYGLYLSTGHAVGRARALSFVAWFRTRAEGASERALAEIEEALPELRRLHHDREFAHANHHRGVILAGLGRLDAAAQSLVRAEAAFALMGDAFFRARSLISLGDVRRELGDREGAQQSWTRAYELLVPYGEPHSGPARLRLEAY